MIDVNRRTEETRDQFNEVVDYLHWNSRKYGYLSSDEAYEVFAEGDGFGGLSADELAQINSGFDWSHVRDSSDEGVLRMHAKLHEILERRKAVA